jgi:hypothetical protein
MVGLQRNEHIASMLKIDLRANWQNRAVAEVLARREREVEE